MGQSRPHPEAVAPFHRHQPPGGATRERLLHAALRRFDTYGFAAVTMDDIAGAAGVSRATLDSFFSAKSDIAYGLFMLLDPPLAAVRRDLDRALVHRSRAAVVAILTEAFDVLRKQQPTLRVTREASVVDPQLALTLTAYSERSLDDLRGFLNSVEENRRPDARRTIEAVFLHLEWMAQQAGDADLTTVANRLADNLTGALGW